MELGFHKYYVEEMFAHCTDDWSSTDDGKVAGGQYSQNSMYIVSLELAIYYIQVYLLLYNENVAYGVTS